ncbi:MAG: SIMPL domain-containing protein [Anaerolineae bacterium]
MLRRIALAALGVGLTMALLITVLGLAPNAALFVSARAQPTITISDTEPLPLTFFLARPSPEFAATLVSLALSDQQANGWAMVLKDEGQLLGESQARGTLAQDVGPIGAASWQRLKDEVLNADQYTALRQWALANRDLALPALRAALEGAATPVAPTSATAVAAAATTVANGSGGAAATPSAAAGAAAGAVSAAAAAATAVQAATPASAIAAAATAQIAATAAPSATPTAIPATVAATSTVSSTAATATTVATSTVSSTTASAATATPTAAAAKPAGGATATTGSITVIGNGRAVATPDVARVTLGVNVTGDTVKAATAEANKNLNAIVAKLKSMGVSDRDIQTTQYNVYPTTDDRPTPAPAGAAAATPKPPKTVYHVQAAVTATLRDLSNVGTIIDAALGAGANTVGGISFTVDNPAPVMDQARADAVASAKAQAMQLAQLNGVTLGPPREITEIIGTSPPQPSARVVPAPVAAAVAAPPTIEGGELTYTDQIQITYEFTQ